VKAYFLTLFRLVRPFTLLFPFIGFLAGALMAMAREGELLSVLFWRPALLGSFMAAFLNATSNIWNQIADVHIDKINKPERPLARGEISRGKAHVTALFFLFIGLSLGLQVGLVTFSLGVIGILFSLVYSFRPRLKRFPFLALLTIALPRGLFLKVAGWSSVGSISTVEPWILGFAFFIFFLGLTPAKDVNDIKGDRLGGIKTLPMIFGDKIYYLLTLFFVLPWCLLFLPVFHSALLPRNGVLFTALIFLIVLGLSLGIYFIRNKEKAGIEKNHLAWTAMYVFAMLAQVIFAGLYVLEEKNIGREPRVIILGFDGLDPRILREAMKKRELPNFAFLAAKNKKLLLRTTIPPETPVAWRSFATGVGPGRHHVFDFVDRNPETYYPVLGTLKKTEPVILGKILLFPPRLKSKSKVLSFYEDLSRQGIRVYAGEIPLELPNDLRRGFSHMGLGFPDGRGHIGSYTWIGAEKKETTEFGGMLIPWEKYEKNVWKAVIPGPRESTSKVVFRQGSPSVLITDQGKYSLKPGKGKWVSLSFSPFLFLKVILHAKVYLQEGRIPKLYFSPLVLSPQESPLRFSFTPSWGKRLWEAIGPFKTYGWAVETWGYNERRLPRKEFLDDALEVFSKRVRKFFYALKKTRPELVIYVFGEFDRVAHMFYREYEEGDKEPLTKILRAYDKFLGRVLGKYPGTKIFVISDHGFTRFSRTFHLNNFLVREKYLAVRGVSALQNTWKLFRGGDFWKDEEGNDIVDWERSVFYGLGLGGLYLNLKGREALGIVPPEKKLSLLNRLQKKLLSERDPKTGLRPVAKVYKREEIYEGPYLQALPDLVLLWNPPYRLAWQSTLGGIGGDIYGTNATRWSGDHAFMDPEKVPGILLSTEPIRYDGERNPHILDIAPTIFEIFGKKPSHSLEGKSLLGK